MMNLQICLRMNIRARKQSGNVERLGKEWYKVLAIWPGFHSNFISILCWNIEGTSSKLYDQELLDYLSNFDIFTLLETWECSQEGLTNLFPGHECLFCPAVRQSQYVRAMSGIAVFIKHSIVKHFKRLTSDCKFGVFLEADKQLFNLERSLIICFIYLPPDNSPFYKNTETNGVKL